MCKYCEPEENYKDWETFRFCPELVEVSEPIKGMIACNGQPETNDIDVYIKYVDGRAYIDVACSFFSHEKCDGLIAATFEIKYCPKCGRPLGEKSRKNAHQRFRDFIHRPQMKGRR